MTEYKKVFETNVRFSKSKIWEMQRDYFDEQGVLAWANQVPFYITSNPVIASKYVAMTLSFLQDCAQKKLLNANKPIYIVELGTGPGKFSFYILKEIFALQKQMGLENFKICYVMTDFTLSNMKYWQSHVSLKPYVDEGKLDFALFNLEKSNTFELVNAKKEITIDDENDNPLIVFANYIFDTVNHDAFAIIDHELMESTVNIYSSARNNKKVSLENIDVHFKNIPIKKFPYYKNPSFNELLTIYKNNLNDTHFLIPIGSLKCIETLLKIAKNKLFLIATDKAHVELNEYKDNSRHNVTFHSSISLKVNLHAVGEFFRLKKGFAFQQDAHKGIKTSVFTTGYEMDSFTKTLSSIDKHIHDFSPADYFNIHSFMRKNTESSIFDSILGHLKLSQYCPHVFSVFIDKIKEEIKSCDEIIMHMFAGILEKVAQNFYYMPSNKDSLKDIADVFKIMHYYERALHYYEESIQFFGEDHITLFEIGACYYEMGQPEITLEKFRYAATTTEDNGYLLENIKMLEGLLGISTSSSSSTEN